MSHLAVEGIEWGGNTLFNQTTPQWIKDDITGATNNLLAASEFTDSLLALDAEAWGAVGKELGKIGTDFVTAVKTGDDYALGGYVFDVATLVGPASISKLKYVDEASALTKLAETSEVASTVGKIEDGVSLSFEKLMSAEDAQKYVAWNNFAKDGISVEERLKIIDDGIYSPKTYIEFLKANPSQNVDDYIELVRGQSPWPKGYVPKYKTLKSGDMFEMALSPGQEDFEPGGFATELGTIKNVDYVRQKLAVKIDWKKEIDRVCVYRVKDGASLPVQIGPVGPQIDLRLDQYLSGGASQKEFLLPREIDKMDYLDIVTDLCREIY